MKLIIGKERWKNIMEKKNWEKKKTFFKPNRKNDRFNQSIKRTKRIWNKFSVLIYFAEKKSTDWLTGLIDWMNEWNEWLTGLWIYLPKKHELAPSLKFHHHQSEKHGDIFSFVSFASFDPIWNNIAKKKHADFFLLFWHCHQIENYVFCQKKKKKWEKKIQPTRLAWMMIKKQQQKPQTKNNCWLPISR